jgi:mycothiol synthase
VGEITVRAPTLDDAPRVAALIEERDRADFGAVDGIAFTGDELREWWGRDEASLETDAWIALRGDEVIAYARVERERDLANVADESCVSPDARGLGLGWRLLDRVERWASERSLARMQVHVAGDDGRRLAEDRGHELVRHFWQMEMELQAEPSVPPLPAGLKIRSYRPGEDDEALHAVHQASFAEHWEFTARPLDEWLRERRERSDYEPSLWRLAVEGDEIAGAGLCFGAREVGWFLELFVGRRRRRRGLGFALFQSGLLALWQRGHTRVGLEVDSLNATGATRLYERAGFQVTRSYATYEKALTDAVESGEQESNPHLRQGAPPS